VLSESREDDRLRPSPGPKEFDRSH
jgi:hypothetical protein